jgi:hypothetical protein
MKTRAIGAAAAWLAVALAVAGCSLLLNGPPPAAPQVSPAVWHLDPDSPPPRPEDTSFVAMVTERVCANGREIRGILLPPVIDYRADEVIVSLYVEPVPGGPQACPGTLPTRFEIPLAEPLGDRQLVDGIGGTDDDPL